MAAKKILLFETDDSVREVVTYVLKNEGFEVVPAGPEITALMKHTTADLILLDEWINANSNAMLCREIKAVHELQRIPVVIFSTAIDVEDIAKSCEADGFVRKPFEINTLVDVIRRCLNPFDLAS